MRPSARGACASDRSTLTPSRGAPSDKCFLDEVFVRILGRLHYFLRAVDQHGNVIVVLVQRRHNTKAAKRFLGINLTVSVLVRKNLAPKKSTAWGMQKLTPSDDCLCLTPSHRLSA